MPTGNIATFFTIQVENQKLSFKSNNNLQLSEIQFMGQIKSSDEKMKGIFKENFVFAVKAIDQDSIIFYR